MIINTYKFLKGASILDVKCGLYSRCARLKYGLVKSVIILDQNFPKQAFFLEALVSEPAPSRLI